MKQRQDQRSLGRMGRLLERHPVLFPSLLYFSLMLGSATIYCIGHSYGSRSVSVGHTARGPLQSLSLSCIEERLVPPSILPFPGQGWHTVEQGVQREPGYRDRDTVITSWQLRRWHNDEEPKAVLEQGLLVADDYQRGEQELRLWTTWSGERWPEHDRDRQALHRLIREQNRWVNSLLESCAGRGIRFTTHCDSGGFGLSNFPCEDVALAGEYVAKTGHHGK